MISSMTAFGSARVENEAGSVSLEFRTVNNRFLDVSLRLPDDLRAAEQPLRELIGRLLSRGKVDARLSYVLAVARTARTLDAGVLEDQAALLAQARSVIPDTPAPRLEELLQASSGGNEGRGMEPDTWVPMCLQAAEQALAELQANRLREGSRLATAMLEQAGQMQQIVDQVEQEQPALLEEHRSKIARKLQDALNAVSPEGFAQISGAELSARIAQESSLFSLRVDIAEELARLRSHISELRHLLAPAESRSNGSPSSAAPAKKAGSTGKRLDFLFQEMNREANTLGSKSASLTVTRAAIDLKLLIEQLREQAQNIE